MPDYSSFIRSIRVRYLSGLLVFALAVGITLYAISSMNAFRNEIDRIGGDLASLARDLHNATAFAETTTSAWRENTRVELGNAASGHATRLTAQIEALSDALAMIRSDLSVATIDSLEGASVNGDLFWSARDMVRNLGLLAGISKIDEWSSREIRNQNNLFVQPMLIRAPRSPRPGARACRAAQRPASVLCHRADDRGAGAGRLLDLPADGEGDPPRFRRIQAGADAGRGGRPRQVGIPGQYEP